MKMLNKIPLNCGSLYVLCLILVGLMPAMCNSHTYTHTKVSALCSGILNLTLSLFLCLPVWVELNRVLWCEWDVSLKNITHQRFAGMEWYFTLRSFCRQSGSCSLFDAAEKVQSVEEGLVIWIWTIMQLFEHVSDINFMIGYECFQVVFTALNGLTII